MAVGPYSTEYRIIPGVRLATAACGIKSRGELDLVLFEFAEGSNSAGIFTKSAFAAAPIFVSRRHLERAGSRFFLINSGNANAATGEQGIADAESCCEALAKLTGVSPEQVIPFSTGVIGEKLQLVNIVEALPKIISGLDEKNWLDAARGIMTTDTRPKIASRQIDSEGTTVTLTGIAKGSGMIQPDMATMLAFIATDGHAEQDFLLSALQTAADKSFNRITIDGDTSTNDSCMLTATGFSGVDLLLPDVATKFQTALNSLMLELAQGIVRDAEGATKFVEVRVQGGRSVNDCLKIAYSITNSPLIKTALFAGDANWGRLIMAIGKAGVDIDINKVDVFIGDVQILCRGGKHPDYTEEAGTAVMSSEDIVIMVELNLGDCAESVWTSDLSHDYVSINSEYRT